MRTVWGNMSIKVCIEEDYGNIGVTQIVFGEEKNLYVSRFN